MCRPKTSSIAPERGAAAAAMRNKTVAGFDWSKIDLQQIVEFVALILKIFV